MKQAVLRACMIAMMAVCGVGNELAAPAAEAPQPFGGKHVLIIGIDGCRCDALQAARVPNLRKLIDSGTTCYRVYVGGELGTKTEQKTSSGPGWASILTGVWADKHQVVDNSFADTNLKKIVDGRIVGYPHFFTRLKEKCPRCCLASIVNWEPINAKIVTDADVLGHGTDNEVAKQAAELLLGRQKPAVVFLQFDDVDHAGHSKEFGPQSSVYMRTIEATDKRIGVVLDALHKRPSFAKEDWLILVTADHGGIGTKHGGQSPEERSVFLIAHGGGYPHQVVEQTTKITTIPATVLRHLGVAIDPSWGWEPAFDLKAP